MQIKKASIRDVAKLAGVSTATVSHVLNNTRVVTPETSDRVWKAVHELDYHPSTIARSLVTQKTTTIGVMVSDIRNPFFTDVVRGIEDIFNASGFNLILCNTDESEEKANLYGRVLLGKRVEGVILAPTGHAVELIQDFISQSIPVVLIDRRPPECIVPFVGVDNIAAAYESVSHLVDDGHQHIGLVSSLMTSSTAQDRIEGYRRALRDAKISLSDELIVSFDGISTVVSAENVVRELFRHPHPPTALFTLNNLLTIGALRAINDLGLRCPEDVAILGFDDLEWASMFTPPLTMVRQPTYEIGTTAASILMRAISGEDITNEEVLLPTKLIVRDSCRPGGHSGNN
jgi:DNA-binding LacI/PurR family transcriptional regulator